MSKSLNIVSFVNSLHSNTRELTQKVCPIINFFIFLVSFFPFKSYFHYHIVGFKSNIRFGIESSHSINVFKIKNFFPQPWFWCVTVTKRHFGDWHANPLPLYHLYVSGCYLKSFPKKHKEFSIARNKHMIILHILQRKHILLDCSCYYEFSMS